MQCYSDLNLECCDCKSTFTSATKLLQHFAEHALKNSKSKGSSGANTSWKRKKRTSDQVSVAQNESSSESSQSRQESTDSGSSSDAGSSAQSCKLARFDLQKRLETCVGSLQEQEQLNDCVASQGDSQDAKAEDEYSPLKFCMITMDENDGKTNIVNSNPKKVASRKQLLPKKIERKGDLLRKLAPKPENAISSEIFPQSPGKKKYACHLCTKVFGWSTDLKRHILVHTGERPFKCEKCQATFTRNFLLQKHQSKVHPCKPKEKEREITVKTELVEIPNVVVARNEDESKVDPLKEEPADGYDLDEDDDDEDKLVITEEIDEKPPQSPESNSLIDSKWHILPPNSDSRCSDLKQSEMFSIAPIKVLTM